MTTETVPTPAVPPRALEDATFLIVGGTSGVGLAIAVAAVEAGVPRIALVGRNEERGAAARARVLEAGPDAQVEFIVGDGNDPESAVATVARSNELLGPVTVLVVSTAGSFDPMLVKDIPVADLPATLTQQALAPIVMSGAVLPTMMAQREGVILNIASDAAKVATPGEAVIGAAMAAIVLFSRTLAMEAKRNGIRVNVLTPSLIENTGIYDRVMAGGFSAKLFSKAAQRADLGVAQPEDLAALALFLASPAAAKLTGQAISVNGGISAA